MTLHHNPRSSRRLSIRNIDKFLHNLHTNRSGYNKSVTIGVSFLIYLGIILGFGNSLRISANYFIILPLVAVTFSFGFKGGVAAGALALPLNLLMFRILGHPEYSPESKLIAEISGLTIGLVLGYLSDYYYEIEVEIERRKTAEEKLQQALSEKEILIQEIHHRVKNNLNIVKSLIQLQSTRSDSKDFKKEAEKLINRIYSISRVHEQLYKGDKVATPIVRDYLPDLIDDILNSIDDGSLKTSYRVDLPSVKISIEQATSLGLILNEILTNLVKYSLPLVEDPELEIVLRKEKNEIVVELINNAPTFIPGKEDYSGLGLKLVKTLSEQLGAGYEWVPGGGTTFRLRMPVSSYGGTDD